MGSLFRRKEKKRGREVKKKVARQVVKESDLVDGVEIGGREVSMSQLHGNWQIKEGGRVVIMFPGGEDSLGRALLYFEGVYGVDVSRAEAANPETEAAE